MKSMFKNPIARLAAGAALLLCAPFAAASDVNWSVSVGTPYVQSIVQTPRVYLQPQQVYVQPQPVYVQPRPVYVQSYSRPVALVGYQHYQPQPYYVVREGRHKHHRGHGRGHGHGRHSDRD